MKRCRRIKDTEEVDELLDKAYDLQERIEDFLDEKQRETNELSHELDELDTQIRNIIYSDLLPEESDERKELYSALSYLDNLSFKL
jgi:cell division septum initiation protein DivIVA